MQKNAVRRLLLLCFCLSMITASLVGTSLAKYTTSATGSDSARVAKWGVVVEANGNGDIFSNEYRAGSSNNVDIFKESTTEISEEASKGDAAVTIVNSVLSVNDKIVAPGTYGNMARVTLSGKPEVAVRVEYKVDVDLGDNWKDKSGNFYCPIEILIKEQSYTFKILQGSIDDTAEDFEKAIKNYMNKYTKEYPPNTDLSTLNNTVITIG